MFKGLPYFAIRRGLKVTACISLLFAGFSVAGEEVSSEKSPAESLLILQQQIRDIRNNQIDYVAREEQRQEEFDKKGKLKKERIIVSDYYRVRLKGANEFVECREVISVDGKKIDTKNSLREMLLSEDRTALDKIDKMMEYSRKYNLGPGRPTHQPWVGLRFADGDRVDYAEYHIDTESNGVAGFLEFQFHETGDSTLFRNGSKPAPAAGKFRLDRHTMQFLDYDISVNKKKGGKWFRLTAQYSRVKDGKLLPVRFEEYGYHKNGRVKIHSVSRYWNYGRFGSETEVQYGKPVE